MRPIHFRIHKLMIVVALIAINLAVLRALFASRRVDVLIGGALLWATLQVGIFRAIGNRNRSRPFWLGFMGFGSIATLSFLAVVYLPQSVAGSVWNGYLVRVEGLVGPIFEASALRNGHPLIHELLFVAVLAMEWVVPLVLAALAGGFLARRFGKRPIEEPEAAIGTTAA